MWLQVPRSSKHVTEDQDYVLMSVVLFRRVVDDFKTAARVRGFQVRPRGTRQQLVASQL
jgi:V-type H+-transporting ATPase subunit C